MLVLAGLLVTLVAGCSVTDSAPANTEAPAVPYTGETGEINIAIAWPSNGSRVIPAATQSISVAITQTNADGTAMIPAGKVASDFVDRSTEGSISFGAVPVGTYTIAAKACKATGGGGQALALASIEKFAVIVGSNNASLTLKPIPTVFINSRLAADVTLDSALFSYLSNTYFASSGGSLAYVVLLATEPDKLEAGSTVIVAPSVCQKEGGSIYNLSPAVPETPSLLGTKLVSWGSPILLFGPANKTTGTNINYLGIVPQVLRTRGNGKSGTGYVRTLNGTTPYTAPPAPYSELLAGVTTALATGAGSDVTFTASSNFYIDGNGYTSFLGGGKGIFKRSNDPCFVVVAWETGNSLGATASALKAPARRVHNAAYYGIADNTTSGANVRQILYNSLKWIGL